MPRVLPVGLTAACAPLCLLFALGCEPPATGPDAGTGGPPLPPAGDGGVVAVGLDADASTVTVDPTSGLLANDIDEAALTVTLVNTSGQPLAGVALRVELDGGGTATPLGNTDDAGVATAAVRSVTPGVVTVRVLVSTADGEVQLPATPTVTFDECESYDRYFRDEVAGPVMNICFGCHNVYGRAPELEGEYFELPGDPGWLEIDPLLLYGFAETRVDVDGTEMPYLLAKPLGHLDHGGGVVLREGDDALARLERFVELVEAGTVCAPITPPELFAGVTGLDATETWRKARFTLTGEVATRDEIEAFGGTEADLDAALDELLASDAFDERLTELANDVWLTEESNTGARALNRLPQQDFPNRFYFRPCSEFSGNTCCTAGNCCSDDPQNSARFCELGKEHGTAAIAELGLQLVRHIKDNELPYTELVEADYLMANPYTAKILGIEGLAFDSDPENDRDEWLPAQLGPTSGNTLTADQPHAGILTVSPWLRRYPTTRTNVNRHRARIVYEKLLGLDVMTFLNLVIEQDEDLGEDPFQDARTCSACHAALDPVAGTFQNWKSSSRYQVNGWEDWMRVPAFRGVEMPAGDTDRAMQWLGGQLALDPRFAFTAAGQWFTLLTSIPLVEMPVNPDLDDYAVQREAFYAQTAYLEELAADFASTGYDLRSLMKEILLGPWFRADEPPAAPEDVREIWLAMGLGVGKTLTPEQLDRKLRATLGYTWTSNLLGTGTNELLNGNRFRLLMGGIDSDVIPTRFRDPFPIYGNVTRRLANELACVTVAQEWSWRDASARRVLRHVERDTVPEDAAGNPVAAGEEAIRAEISDLHLLLLGEHVEDGDPELEATYQLFLDVWRAGKTRVDNNDESQNLLFRCRATVDWTDPNVTLPEEGTAVSTDEREQVLSDPDYTVRAWRAVLVYLLSDYRFLFE